MRKIYVAAALLAGLAGVSACGSQAAQPDADVAAEQVPVAVQDSAAPVNPQGPGELPGLAGAQADPPAAPPVFR